MGRRARLVGPKGLEDEKAKQVDLKRRFIEAYIHLGSMDVASRHIGFATSTIDKWRKEDPAFDEGVVAAKDSCTEELKAIATRRARDSTDKASALLLMFMIKGRDPSFKERFDMNMRHSGPNGGPIASVATRVMVDLKGIPKEKLLKALDLL